MVDWSLVAKIAGGGYGLCILILVILALVAWIVGLVVQRTVRGEKRKGRENSVWPV